MITLNNLKTKSDFLAAVWVSLIEGSCPPERQFNLWLQIHNGNTELIAWGIRELALKLSKRQMDDGYRVKFVSSIINKSPSATEEHQICVSASKIQSPTEQ